MLDSFEKGALTVQSSADLALEPPRSFGERAADAVGSFGGSWGGSAPSASSSSPGRQ
ncbi:putative membrane protein [Pseudorhizobium tarimense]|uniref:Membrane protein n=1 Tax=Pseudorhizobium tarimense TaxID=1079109 RepID=A0ABV2HCL2_9HYPH|nr:hypothetical protein [Pseudorhizobium tarimense]